MINLIEIASGGRFQSGQLVDEHNMRDVQNLTWNGSTSNNYGFIGPLNNALLGNGTRADVLQMHPKWVRNGGIKAWLPWRRLPELAVFKGKIAFLNGASGTDGAVFQIWEHHNVGVREVWNRVFHHTLTSATEVADVIIDLSHLSGQNVGIELRVDAGESSGRDWAVWVNPMIESRTEGPRANIWTLAPVSLRVNDRNETRRIEGRGDEPYLGAVYFRSIFGKKGTTKVAILDRLDTLGDNIGEGGSVTIPRSAGLSVSDVGVSWNNALTGFSNGIQIMGYQFVAMEEDKRGKGKVKDTLNELGGKLFAALKENIEDNPLGLLNPEETIQNIEDDVFGTGGEGGSNLKDSIKKAFVTALKWLGRTDDVIGQNQIIIIGLTESVLREQLGEDFTPDATESPIAPLSRRTFTLDFAGSDAQYSLRVNCNSSDTAILVR